MQQCSRFRLERHIVVSHIEASFPNYFLFNSNLNHVHKQAIFTLSTFIALLGIFHSYVEEMVSRVINVLNSPWR